jgi:large subunit ribosomal protein L9
LKVILLEDVPNLGKRGEVAIVKDGFAINYLFPRNLAAESSAGALARLQAQAKAKQRREAEARADAEKLAKLLETRPVSVPVKCGGNGRLFGTVTNANVAEAIHRDFEIEVDRHKIEMPENIKSLGTYQIIVRLGKSINAKAQLQVIAA